MSTSASPATATTPAWVPMTPPHLGGGSAAACSDHAGTERGGSAADGLVQLGQHPVVDAGEPARGEGLLEEAADAAGAVPGGLHRDDAAVGALGGDGPGGHHAGVRVGLHDPVR